MKICKSCFNDNELKAYIDSNGIIEDCPVCNSKGDPTIDSAELKDFFQELFQNFEPDEDGDSLISILQGQWDFFSSSKVGKKVLNGIIGEIDTTVYEAESNVRYQDEIVDNINYWETIKEKLKWEFRYITDIDYLTDELGWDSFFNSQFELRDEITLYRARLHHKITASPYDKTEMGNPPKLKTSGGRANPDGIPYLYLSKDLSTTLYEVRATLLDYVSVGEFKKQKGKKLKIVDFIDQSPLFQPGRVNQVMKENLLKKRISRDLSKPMRRYDAPVEYIPTQFICEFIAVFTGAHGIRFQSSVDINGENYVIFKQEKLECTNVKLVSVKKIDLKFTEIVKP